LHLDHAGRMELGRVIWLPEFGQERLNNLCLAIFLAARKISLYRKDEATRPVVETALRLYGAFEGRRAMVESLLGGGAVKDVLPRDTLSSPAHIASLIAQSARKAGLDSVQVAKRVEGLRLLPDPTSFEQYIEKAASLAHRDFPVQAWAPATREELEAISRQSAQEGVFDAAPAVIDELNGS